MGIAPPLETQLAGISLRNPIIAAAGTCGYLDELADAMDLSRIGAVTTKSITQEVREGNEPMRMIPTRAGMLNAVGLANKGVARFLAEDAPRVPTTPTRVFASIAGHSIEEFAAVARAVDGSRAFSAVEVNVSCPNTATGRAFGSDAATLRSLLQEVRGCLGACKMFVKLAPDMCDPIAMSKAAIDCGANALVLCNTLPGMAINVESRRSRLSRPRGGMSGPGVHPLVVRIVSDIYTQVCKEAGVPIIGLGGVMSWEDAAELILVGATAVGVGTALFVDPRAPLRMVSGLDAWVTRQGCSSINQLVGQAQL